MGAFFVEKIYELYTIGLMTCPVVYQASPLVWSLNPRLNRPFLSSLVPLFQNESKCETILMKMTLICMEMKLRAELIFIWKVSHLDSFWNRGTRELGNGLLNRFSPWSESDVRKAYTSEWHEKLQSRSHAQTSLILACWSWPVTTCCSNYSKEIVDQLPIAYSYVYATQLYLSLRGCSGCNAVLH